jgi:hypothetical protein
MVTLFSDKPYGEVIAGLREIGYSGALLEEDYGFRDYFSAQREERQIAAAAFGQTPISYDSACIGVALANGLRERALVNTFRALGAPILLEVDNYEVREWAVSGHENDHALVASYPADRIRQMIESRAPDWKPQRLLRDKNIGSFQWAPQLSLFAGLLPELEEQIQALLEPLLHDALSTTKSVYRETSGHEPDAGRLFKLIFWILTAKVFHDRRVIGFRSLGGDPDDILNAVAKQYGEVAPRLLNRQAREAAVNRIWSLLDFRNLSVEVLAQMWSSMLIDDDIRRRLGIHRTSRTIVRYIVERIPFEHPGDDKLIVFEPCSGSAVFLIGAMNFLRHRLFGASPAERHKYFTQHLSAIEAEPFGVEISRLALTLADFPNPGGWDVAEGDVFEPGVLTDRLRRAGVVLCNPPFGDFEPDERQHYQFASTHKPVEVLNRVLDDLHPSGVLGFVLPRIVVDGRGYADVRRRLAQRFASIELVVLPDRAFESDPEVGLLVATEPIPHDATRVVSRKVSDNVTAWERFALRHEVSSDYTVFLSADEATRTFAVSELPEVWNSLVSYPILDDIAKLHRGLEWNAALTKDGAETGNRSRFVRTEPAEGFMRGVPPQTSLNIFELPETLYLSRRREDARGNAYQYAWDKPKALVNGGGSARSRGPWKLSATPDSEGITCYQNHIGVWPTSADYDEWLLSAILNSPLANAFVATRSGKLNITIETLKLIPVPYFTDSQKLELRSLIEGYRDAVRDAVRPRDELGLFSMDQRDASDSGFLRGLTHDGTPAWPSPTTPGSADAERLLMRIDALVLDAYRIHPKVENQLLNYFRGSNPDRRTGGHFHRDYLPQDCEVYFSLSEHLSPKFGDATAGELRKRMGLA